MQFYILTQTLCWVDTGQWMRMRVFASTSFSNSSHQDHFTGLASAKESDFYNSTNTETNIRLSQSCLWHADLKVQIKALSVWVITILRLVDECIVVRNIIWIVVALMLPVISFQHSFWGVEEGRLRFFQKYFFIFPTNCLLSLAISPQTGHTALINTQNNWRPPQGSKCKQITFHWHVFGTPKNHIWKDTLMYFLDIWKALLGHCWWMGQVVNAPSPRPKMIVSLSVSPFKGLLLIL